MAYKLMVNCIKQGRMSKASLTTKANVFYMAGQLSDEEYAEIMEMIDKMD